MTTKPKIWILKIEEDNMTFWKEDGHRAWSRNIETLMRKIENGYEVRYCKNGDDSYLKWRDQ